MIAGVTAGIIAAGGITAAVINSKKGKDQLAEVSVSTVNENENIAGNIAEADNSVTDVSNRKRKPFELTYAEVPKDEYTYFNGLWYKLPEGFFSYGFDTWSDDYVKLDSNYPEYGVINVTHYVVGSEHKTKEEVRELFFEDFDKNEVLNVMEEYPFFKEAKADTSETVNIIGHEFLRETGTIIATDFIDTWTLSYTAYFGNLAFPVRASEMETKDLPRIGDDTPVIFMAFSTDNSSEKKAQLSEWADYIAESVEDPADRYNDLLPDDGYTAESDGSEIKGKITKAGNFEVFLPDGWSMTGPGGAKDPEWGITLLEDSDPHTKIMIRYHQDDAAHDMYVSAVNTARDKHSMEISGAQTVDEFTCGDYCLKGVKYTKIMEDNAGYPAAAYFHDRGTGKNDVYISTVKYDEDTPEFQAIIRSLKINN